MPDALAVVGWTRVILLAGCLGGAAWLDLRTRRVANGYWLQWARPFLLLWGLDLAIRGADWTTWLSASAVVAWASTYVIGTPSWTDVKAGSVIDITVLVWYVVSAAGVIGGILVHGPVVMDDLAGVVAGSAGSAIDAARPWLEVVGVALVILALDLAWRARLIHGGADAKGTMLVAIALPWWTSLPLAWEATMLPPALALYLWGGVAMLLVPVGNLVRNGMSGDLGRWRLAWFAVRIERAAVPSRQVWLLDQVVDAPNGGQVVRTRMRAPRRSDEAAAQALELEALEALGIERVWVTQKWPFTVFMAVALLLLLLFGDAMAWVVPWLTSGLV